MCEFDVGDMEGVVELEVDVDVELEVDVDVDGDIELDDDVDVELDDDDDDGLDGDGELDGDVGLLEGEEEGVGRLPSHANSILPCLPSSLT